MPVLLSPVYLVSVDWQTLDIHQDDATVFVVRDLLPDSIYEFSVQSQTASGDALFSKVIRVRTKATDDYDHTTAANGSQDFFLSETQKKTFHHHLRREGIIFGVDNNNEAYPKSRGTSTSTSLLNARLDSGEFEIDGVVLPPLQLG